MKDQNDVIVEYAINLKKTQGKWNTRWIAGNKENMPELPISFKVKIGKIYTQGKTHQPIDKQQKNRKSNFGLRKDFGSERMNKYWIDIQWKSPKQNTI